MSFLTDWSPDKIEEVRSQWAAIKVPIDNIDTEKAAKLQLAYASFASELTMLLAQVRLYEKRKVAEAKRKETEAFLLARGDDGEKLSDRKRDAMASRQVEVRLAKANADEAEVYRKLVEDLRDDAITAHHACKAILKSAAEEMGYYGRG